ncbi:hypothetical protein C0992_007423 [Termitomyces sp. T32_za158]|nr:hypothetical protein C0992_007423 [Termitomyces sp. T32_za158]
MHGVWRMILDDDFMHAYQHGIVIKCLDGIQRRFYPRIFTYSADYPEKILLATIRNMGSCPCPRCIIPKDRIPELGTKLDASRRQTLARSVSHCFLDKIQSARDAIYQFGYKVKSAFVERILGEESLVPTSNAFAKLSDSGLNLFQMLVPDFMHEFELGVWKHVFAHLVRILVANGGTSVQYLNQRYRMVPPFGRFTI